MPKSVVSLMKEEGPRLFVAGGFVRSCVANESIRDIDLFCSTKDGAKICAQKINTRRKIHETDNAFTIRAVRGTMVQFIHRWLFDAPAQCLESFDFTIACGAFWYDNGWQSLCDDRFYPDLASKRLIYRSPRRNEDAGGSLLRVLKFYQRGYRIPLDSLGAVIARLLSGVDQDKVRAVAASDGNSIEQQTARILTGLLREVDPDIDPTHVAHLPSSLGE